MNDDYLQMCKTLQLLTSTSALNTNIYTSIKVIKKHIYTDTKVIKNAKLIKARIKSKLFIVLGVMK